MRQRSTSLLTLFCLVLAVLSAAGWWRSWLYADNLDLSNGPRPVILCSGEGRLGVLRFGSYMEGERFFHNSMRRDGRTASFLQYMTEQPESSNLLRFAAGRGASGSLGGEWWVAAPYWWITAICAAFPAVRARRWARHLRRERRERAGCCPACGYDLRATLGRCPECGAARAVPAGAAA